MRLYVLPTSNDLKLIVIGGEGPSIDGANARSFVDKPYEHSGRRVVVLEPVAHAVLYRLYLPGSSLAEHIVCLHKTNRIGPGKNIPCRRNRYVSQPAEVCSELTSIGRCVQDTSGAQYSPFYWKVITQNDTT